MVERCQVMSMFRDDDGFLSIRYDGSGNDEEDRPAPVEALSPYGIVARPRQYAGDDKPGTNCLVQVGNGIAWGMACSDPRIMGRLPPLNEGSAFLYGDIDHDTATSFVWIDGESGNVQLYAPHGSTASTIVLNVGDPNDAIVQILHGKGMGIVLRGSGNNGVTIHNRDGSAVVEINDNGIVLRGKVSLVGGVVAGNAPVAEDIALASPLIALLSKIAPVLGYATGLAQAAAIITPEQSTEIFAALAPWIVPEAPTTRTAVIKASSVQTTVV